MNVLNYIMNSLGFGNVIKQSIKSNTHRFIVQDRANLVLISLIFNGNMVFPTRANRLNTFLSALYEKLQTWGEHNCSYLCYGFTNFNGLLISRYYRR